MIYLTILFTIMFCLAFTALHGNIARQLDEMKVTNKERKRLANIFKGQWHTAGLLVRLGIVGILSTINWHVGLSYAAISLLLYDSLLDMWRGKSFLHFTGTCEKWGTGFDTDCFWIKLKEITHIEPIFFRLAIMVILLIIINIVI